jgi:AcrR family transcriptional regulator
MEETETPRATPKDRIVATARKLFRKHGIRGVGVDTIAEAAGTNKMTLYRHFGSKDELIVACLRQFAATADTVWDDLAGAHPGDALAQIHEWVRLCADYVACNGRGCDMANVAVELAEHDHPARRIIEEFERTQRDRLAALCRAAGMADADLLADSLTLLLDGARVNQQCIGGGASGERFRRAAEAVIAAFAARSTGTGAVAAQDGLSVAKRPGSVGRNS